MTWPALIAELDALSGQALGQRIAELQASLPRDMDRPPPAHWPAGDPRRALCQRVRRRREADAYPAYIDHLQRVLPRCRLWTHGKSFRDVHGVWRNAALCEGMADLVGICDGRYLEVEVKTARGRQEQSQRQHQALVEQMGGLYVVARTPQEAEALIRQALRLRSQCEVLGGMIAAGGPRGDE